MVMPNVGICFSEMDSNLSNQLKFICLLMAFKGGGGGRVQGMFSNERISGDMGRRGY